MKGRSVLISIAYWLVCIGIMVALEFYISIESGFSWFLGAIMTVGYIKLTRRKNYYKVIRKHKKDIINRLRNEKQK